MAFLQDIIHRFEVGGGIRAFGRYFYIGTGALAVLVLFAGYNFRAYRNFASMEAMDTAQLARNIAEGRGYTTHFVRPFSMYLQKQTNAGKPALGPDGRPDPLRIRGAHPDISNPPVYPLALAGLMSALPFNYDTGKTNWFWSIPARLPDGSSPAAASRMFYRHQPEFLICLFNQALLGVCIVLTFFIARKLFERLVAWVTAILMLGTELLWRFSVSGLSTMLLMAILLGLVWVLLLLDRETEDESGPLWKALSLAATTGLLVGIGGLTRYSFGWLIVPLAAWLAVLGGKARWWLALSAFVAFLLVLSPWAIRNVAVSGSPFGTAGYALLEGTPLFPEFRLQRSLEPGLEVGQNILAVMMHKSVVNSRQIVQSDLPRLGGTWLSAFFLVGLLVGCNKPRVRRLRYFVVGSLAAFAIVQALGSTHVSEAYPVVNTENLLVLLTPLVIAYGVSLFFLLLDTVEFPFREMRYFAIGLFGVVASLPLLLTLMPPSTRPFAWPPYYPQVHQKIAEWMNPQELTMSDLPWAIAWYGNRQSAWLTLNRGKDFLDLSDYHKPVQLLCLSQPTLDSRIYSDALSAGAGSWAEFYLSVMLAKRIPEGFPLKTLAPLSPQFFILTDWERWRKPSETGTEKTPAGSLTTPTGSLAPSGGTVGEVAPAH